MASKIEDSERRAADAEARTSALDAIIVEIRGQVERADASIEQLRSNLDVECQARVKAETERKDANLRIEEERKTLDDARTRLVTTEKGVVRLLPVSERARQLFGNDGVGSAADWIEDDPVNHLQLALFPEMEQDQARRIRGRGRGKVTIDPSAVDGESIRKATTLDRVHAAMLLQAGGQANAFRALIKAEQDRGPDFLRLSNALSALYPVISEEKRLLDAMLLAVPR